MHLIYNGEQYQFSRIPLHFAEGTFTDVFALKSNTTLAETVAHKRYLSLEHESRQNYPNELNTPIGIFLSRLKSSGDIFYKRFLNRYGDLTYSRFWLEDKTTLEVRGVYLYADNDRLLYIGRCKDSFSKRINQGYGRISPKNCFIDGQATNCHINSLITGMGGTIQFKACPMPDIPTIVTVEAGLIQQYRPEWNIKGV
jgi:hypothetical protein